MQRFEPLTASCMFLFFFFFWKTGSLRDINVKSAQRGEKKLRKFILQDWKEDHDNSGFGALPLWLQSREMKLVQSVLSEEIVVFTSWKRKKKQDRTKGQLLLSQSSYRSVSNALRSTDCKCQVLLGECESSFQGKNKLPTLCLSGDWGENWQSS